MPIEIHIFVHTLWYYKKSDCYFSLKKHYLKIEEQFLVMLNSIQGF